MLKVRAIQSGSVKIKSSQLQKADTPYPALLNILFSKSWSDWLPIYAWVIEHPEGIFVVDTGESAKTGQPGYLPGFHPYYKFAVQFNVQPEDEIGPQLERLGIAAKDVKTVILTHLHTDHAGGLHHFPHSEILVDNTEYQAASGFAGRANGYLPHRWPDWFDPKPITFIDASFGPFSQSCPLTKDDRIAIVPTPGHTNTHVSVIVRGDDITWFLAGDASYNQEMMVQGKLDGLSSQQAHQTLKNIQQFVQIQPTVYLPSHDPQAGQRLAQCEVVVD